MDIQETIERNKKDIEDFGCALLLKDLADELEGGLWVASYEQESGDDVSAVLPTTVGKTWELNDLLTALSKLPHNPMFARPFIFNVTVEEDGVPQCVPCVYWL